MKKNFLISFLLLLSFWPYAQNLKTPSFGNYTQLTTYSNQFKDVFSVGANQASLASIKKFTAGIFSERRFMMQELSAYHVAAAQPTKAGNIAINAAFFGGDLYRESSVGLAFARSAGSKLDAGVQFNYHSLVATGYGKASVINFDAAIILHLTPRLNAGMHVYNPVAVKFGKDGEEKLPAAYSVGLGYDVSEKFFVTAAAEKTEDESIALYTGFHYAVADKLFAKAGVNTATSVYVMGFGVKMKTFRLDVTGSLHPYLGLTPGLLLVYSGE